MHTRYVLVRLDIDTPVGEGEPTSTDVESYIADALDLLDRANVSYHVTGLTRDEASRVAKHSPTLRAGLATTADALAEDFEPTEEFLTFSADAMTRFAEMEEDAEVGKRQS